MVSQHLVSVIVPVFNAECYLSGCLDSLIQQTYQDFELILIDDGSTDSSAYLCDMYAVKDSRIRVFHRENKGSAASRQFGFEQSVGKYVACVDADDWVETNYLETMLTTALENDADMVISAFWRNCGDEQFFCSNCPSSTDIDVCQKDALLHKCHAGLWNKLLKREILLSGQVLIPQFDFYEDMVVTLSYLQHCKTVYYTPTATYHYRFNNNSLTNIGDISNRIQMLEQMLMNIQMLFKAIIVDSKDSALQKAFFSCVNKQKLRLVDEYPEQYSRYKSLFSIYFPNSYSAYKVKGITTLCRYCALRGAILPFLLLKKLSNGFKR